MTYFLFKADNFELNLIFTEEELEVFRELWNEIVSARTIASNIWHKAPEIALLVFDHAELGCN